MVFGDLGKVLVLHYSWIDRAAANHPTMAGNSEIPVSVVMPTEDREASFNNGVREITVRSWNCLY